MWGRGGGAGVPCLVTQIIVLHFLRRCDHALCAMARSSLNYTRIPRQRVGTRVEDQFMYDHTHTHTAIARRHGLLTPQPRMRPLRIDLHTNKTGLILAH